MQTSSENGHNGNGSKKRVNKWALRGGSAVAGLLLLVLVFGGRGESDIAGPTFAARQGPMEITVVEGGNVVAREAQDIRSQVQGQTTIISIVDEGYQVTPEDVAEGKVLVELDSSDLIESLTQQEITYQNASASLTEAREQFEIQVSQNESDVHDAELALKFAQMDLERFLGAYVGQELLEMLDERHETMRLAAGDRPSAQFAAAGFDPSEVDLETFDVQDIPQIDLGLDYRALLEDPRLGGEAQQRLRDLESNITLAQEELKQAEDRHQWTTELATRGFVTTNEEEQDRLTVQRREIQLQASDTAMDLYAAYEFPKQLENLISDYEQRMRNLERTERQAAARMAQAEARLRTNESTYQLQARRLDDLKRQLENCIIRAERPGIVVYAGSNNQRGDDMIQEGTMVRERQEILTIPDMTRMAVNVQVHESMVNRLRTGLPARIRADAFPDETLRGEVTRVALVPDSGHRWLNPDLRVFPTTVTIEGEYSWLKPGMTAEVEILVNRIDDAVYVPMQCVITQAGQRYVYVVDRGRVEARPVETGPYNDRFITIDAGLAAGEHVLVRPPRPDRATAEDEDNGAREEGPVGMDEDMIPGVDDRQQWDGPPPGMDGEGPGPGRPAGMGDRMRDGGPGGGTGMGRGAPSA